MTAQPLAMLLDMDGTLVNSLPGIQASCEAALGALGHRPESLDISALIGPPLEVVMGQILERLGDDRVAEAVVAYREHYAAAGLLASSVYPGVAEALEGLSAMNVRLYVATSKRRVFAERIVEHLGLAGIFAGVHGSEPDGALDDKADLIAHLLQRHGLRADRTLMVGDRRHDIAGALANGVSAVGVLWGYGERAELETAGAHRIISQPGDLIALAEAIDEPFGAPP